jgi:hypothetical protein
LGEFIIIADVSNDPYNFGAVIPVREDASEPRDNLYVFEVEVSI